MIDSASDINKYEAENLGVILQPITITFGTKEYKDGVDIMPDEFYDKLFSSDVLPKTSQIPPYVFEEEFEKYTANGDELIVITLSSRLSGTYNNAVNASKKFGGKVVVVDSLNACVGERLLCLYALSLIKNGEDMQSIVAKLESEKLKINVIAVLDTLEYLKKGGRVSSAAATIGSMLSIKPVIAVVDGEIKVVGKAMGTKKGNSILTKYVTEKGLDFTMPYATVWSGKESTKLDAYIKDYEFLWQGHSDSIPKYILGATIGTHIGGGVVGVAFFEKDKA
jgi:DegV family protein with EDD domain